jgi:FlaG/FlaF family flagellin (archaellin)
MAASNQSANPGAFTKGGSPFGQGQSGSSNRGFASMDPERQRQVATGEPVKAAHIGGNPRAFTTVEARDAARKGGTRSGGGGATGGR